jgi:YVTN family beta-propeller protein
MQQQEGYSFPWMSTGEPGGRRHHLGWQRLTSFILAASLAILGPGGVYANNNGAEEVLNDSSEESEEVLGEEIVEEVVSEEDAESPAVDVEAIFAGPTKSSNIAITTDNRFLVVVNRQNDTVSVIEVRDTSGRDVGRKLAEIDVGAEPRFVALTPDNQEAYVTNAEDGTVAVIRLVNPNRFQVVETIDVQEEPRGVCISPNGKYAFVAQHTPGTVSVILTSSKQVINTFRTGGNPHACAISNDGDDDDDDERVFITRFFSEVINPGNRPDGFDDAKQGIINSFQVGDALSGGVNVAQHFLKPRDRSGFTADRRPYCLKTRRILQDTNQDVFFNSGADNQGDGAEQLAHDTFCPNNNSNDASATGPIGADPQGVYPNALWTALIRGNSLLVANEGAAPEPPFKFNVNVHGLVGVIDIPSGRETNRTVNLNEQVAVERAAGNVNGIDGLFLNTIADLDANRAGTLFVLVSQGGNYVIEAIPDNNGRLSIGAPNGVVRYQTGNIPTGVVMSFDARRAYSNNEVSTSVTVIDLVRQRVLKRDLDSSTPPAPGSKKHRITVGKLVFFTALGTPNDGIFNRQVRQIIPLQFRGKASDNAWSSCASCHPDGRTDNVTWSFDTGPRQTIDLVGTFGRGQLGDQRINNWSAVRGDCCADFTANSIAVQGGTGFVDNPALIFNHGPKFGVSDAVDAEREWIAAAVRPLNMPQTNPAAIARGRNVFEANCASCHGGVKWTKSRSSPVYDDNPAYPEDPLQEAFFDNLVDPASFGPVDPRVIDAQPQIRGVNDPVAGTLFFMDDVGTFDPTSPIELRGGGDLGPDIRLPGGVVVKGQNTRGFLALPVNAAVGFNAPSLLNVGYGKPFLHDGSAPSLAHVFNIHRLPQFAGSPTIRAKLNNAQRADLSALLNSIDGNTDTFRSATDEFLQRR